MILKNDFIGRAYNEVRPIYLQYDVFGNADASVLFIQGNTKVLASVTLQDGVPAFLKGQKQGWLAAEYAMLPCAPSKRIVRESSQQNKNSRSVEISRLIGRSLRSVVDIFAIPEKTVWVDCDVLSADGGTRVASITAASIALKIAQDRWLNNGKISRNILKEEIAAISVGVVNNQIYLDLDFALDSNASTDFNFVVTRSNKLIEIQGTAEKEPLSLEAFEELKKMALVGIAQVFNAIDNGAKIDEQNPKKLENNIVKNNLKENKIPLFSLANRLSNN